MPTFHPKPTVPTLDYGIASRMGLIFAALTTERGATPKDVVQGSLASAQVNPVWGNGPHGPNLSFSSSGYAQFPHTAQQVSTNGFSIELLIAFTIATTSVIFEKNGNSGFSVQTGTGASAGKLSMSMGGGSAVTGGKAWNDDLFHHVVITSSPGAIQTLYVDGTNDTATTTVRTPTFSTVVLNLGSRAGTFPFTGRIAKAAIYNRPLTQTQVSTLAMDPFAMFRPRRKRWFGNGLLYRRTLSNRIGSRTAGGIL